jgi:hypothetical protein
MSKNGNFFVIEGDGYESDDQRDHGSSELPPLLCAFFCTETLGVTVCNTGALARAEFKHDNND